MSGNGNELRPIDVCRITRVPQRVSRGCYHHGMLSPEIIALLVGGATLLFGAERLPKLARSVGQARKEFLTGQAEAQELATKQTAEQKAVRA